MVSLALRLLLAAALAVAAVAKLRDPAGARAAAADLGVPRRAAGGVAVALPVVELAIAAALLPRGSAVVAAAAAFALLAVFTAVIAVALLRGRAPACHCFGELSAEPVGGGTLARNAVLLAAAAVVVLAGPGRGAFTVGVAAAVAAAVALGGGVAFVLRVLQTHGRVLVRLDALEAALREAGIGVDAVAAAAASAASAGPPVGAAVPAEASARVGLARDRPTLVLFTAPDCGPCRALSDDVAAWRGRADLAVRAVAARAGDGDVPDVLDPERLIAKAFGVTGTPAAVIVGADGRVASAVASGPDAVRALVAAPLPLPAVGRVVPAGELETLEGEVIDVADQAATLVFWSSSCGYCRAIVDDLRELGADARALLVVAADTDALRADDLPFTTVLDPGRRLARGLGATGTPMAVRVAGGRTVSPVAAGGPASLALLRGGGAPRAARLVEVVR